MNNTHSKTISGSRKNENILIIFGYFSIHVLPNGDEFWRLKKQKQIKRATQREKGGASLIIIFVCKKTTTFIGLCRKADGFWTSMPISPFK